jgi:ABC-type methionine transport system ATPase subunit
MASLKKTHGICQKFIIQHSQLFQIRNVYENLTFKLAINNQYCDLA